MRTKRLTTLTLALLTLALPAARAATQPQTYGVKWAHAYNRAAYTYRQPLRIIQIGCRNGHVGGLPTYVCDLVARDVNTRRLRCLTLVLGDSGQVLGGQKHTCHLEPTA